MIKPKILLLFTGGTIAQVKDPQTGTLLPAQTPTDILTIAPELQAHFDIGYEFIVDLDSSNIQPHHWVSMAQTIYTNYNSYDGFVIAHGTDTMSYTASALSFALTNLGKPVVLTGSQLPITALGSDGKNNLINAFRVAAMDIGEVAIVFGDKILRGNRSSKQSESSFDAFWSPIYSDLGKIRIEIELYRARHVRDETRIPILQAQFQDKVCVFTATPGIPPVFFDAIVAGGAKGIILRGFGPGNLPTQDNSLTASIKHAVTRGIPVVITSQCAAGTTKIFLYETGRIAQQMGAISGEDMTLEAAVSKLMWVLSQTSDMQEITRVLQADTAGELAAK